MPGSGRCLRRRREHRRAARQAGRRPLHVWHNLAEHVEKAVGRHHPCVKKHLASPPPTVPAPDLDQLAGDAANQHADRSVLVTRTRQRYEAVHALRAQGKSIKAISREHGLARGTVRRFARAASMDELLAKPRAGRPSILDDYVDYLHQRFNEGCTSATELCAEIAALGYRGTVRTVRSYLQPLRAAGIAPKSGDVDEASKLLADQAADSRRALRCIGQQQRRKARAPDSPDRFETRR